MVVGAAARRRRVGRRSPAVLRQLRRHQRGGHHAAAQLRRPRPHVLPDLRPVEGPGRLGPADDRGRCRSPSGCPLIGGGRVHAGIFIAARRRRRSCGSCFAYTPWGFRLRVVGGNAEAARRAGLAVGALLLVGAWLVGGALAGLGGLTQLAGAEFKLRPGLRRRLRLHRLPRLVARPAPTRCRSSLAAVAARRIADRRRRPADRLPACPAASGQHPHGRSCCSPSFGWRHASEKATCA